MKTSIVVILSLCKIEPSIRTPSCVKFAIGSRSDRYRMVNTRDKVDEGDGRSGRPWGPKSGVDGFETPIVVKLFLCVIELLIKLLFNKFDFGYRSDRYRMVNTSDEGDDGGGGSGRP